MFEGTKSRTEKDTEMDAHCQEADMGFGRHVTAWIKATRDSLHVFSLPTTFRVCNLHIHTPLLLLVPLIQCGAVSTSILLEIIILLIPSAVVKRPGPCTAW